MKALFLGNVAADTANGIRAELTPELQVEIIADPKELSPEIAANTDILVTNIWRGDYPPGPQIRFVQSVATGIEWIEQAALPRGVPVCNAYGHETAIAEYVVMPEKVPDSAVKFYEDRFVNLWRFADAQLAQSQYLAGNEITAADLAVYPIYAGRRALPDNAGLKNLQAWGERVGARPGVQKGMKLEA